MAENQGVLGDQWNDYANRLLKLLGWEHIGDKDMDITGSGGETYGIDAIARYESPGHPLAADGQHRARVVRGRRPENETIIHINNI